MSVWRYLMVLFNLRGGNNINCWVWRQLDVGTEIGGFVCVFDIWGGGDYTEGLLSWRDLARYWKHNMGRWSSIGNILVSSCRWSMKVVFTQPMATRRAESWIVWSFWIIDLEAFGNHMVHDKDKGFVDNTDGSFCLTQLVPARALRMLIRVEARLMIIASSGQRSWNDCRK